MVFIIQFQRKWNKRSFVSGKRNIFPDLGQDVKRHLLLVLLCSLKSTFEKKKAGTTT